MKQPKGLWHDEANRERIKWSRNAGVKCGKRERQSFDTGDVDPVALGDQFIFAERDESAADAGTEDSVGEPVHDDGAA